MATFYAGQTDYIAVLNTLATANQLANISSSTSYVSVSNISGHVAIVLNAAGQCIVADAATPSHFAVTGITTQSAVSGSAIGLLAIGVLQGLPKCLAVQNWIKGIWTIYYTRKYGTSTDTDYSSAGLCPHSVPELMAELGL